MTAASKNNPAFMDALLKSTRHLVSGQMQPYLIQAGGPNLTFLEALIRQELVGKEAACRIWGDSLGFAYVNPLLSVVTDEAVRRVPREIAEKAQVIGLFVINDILTIAMATPEDATLIQRLQAIVGCPLSPVFALPKEIDHAIKLYYEEEASLQSQILDWDKAHATLLNTLEDDSLRKMIQDSSIPQLLDGILFNAIRQRASDIHFEPRETDARIRYRIDGRLQEFYTCGRAVMRAFLIRCKVLAKLNLAETRLPQDGRFSLPFGMGQADFRFSEVPIFHGSKGVLRILSGSRSKGGFRLDDLSMLPRVQQPFRRLLQSPNGIFLVTGPTGSGKTTTLYAALDALNEPDVNIATIEDPIEIQLEGTNQCQTNAGIGLSFNVLLRSLLRQDPDIILVGEIRDGETAKIATQAALTGHIVLSTLHTNNAVQAIVRLIDLGVEPYLVSPSIIGVMAQRLARRICENCKQGYTLEADVLKKYFTHIPEEHPVTFYKGKGCPACRNTGYLGRVALHELVVIDDGIRGLIVNEASQAEILARARQIGCRSLRYDGLKKALLGITTIEEVNHLTVAEWET